MKAVTVFPLLLVVPVCPVLAGPPDAPGRDFGKTKVEFPVPSTWVVVTGSKGGTPVTEGSVTFKDGDKVEVHWKTASPGRSYEATWQGPYRLDPESGLPAVGPPVTDPLAEFVDRGTFRLAGRRLEFKMVMPDITSLAEPRGDLLLILKPGEK